MGNLPNRFALISSFISLPVTLIKNELSRLVCRRARLGTAEQHLFKLFIGPVPIPLLEVAHKRVSTARMRF